MTLIKISEFERLPESRQDYLLKWKIDNLDLYQSKFGGKTLTELSATDLLSISDMIIRHNEMIGFAEWKSKNPFKYNQWFGDKKIEDLSEIQYLNLRTLVITSPNTSKS